MPTVGIFLPVIACTAIFTLHLPAPAKTVSTPMPWANESRKGRYLFRH